MASGAELSPEERERLEAIRSAESLADLVEVTGAEGEHEAYFRAKRSWRELRGKEIPDVPPSEGFPGDLVVVDGGEFHVHGITHADTEPEQAFLHEHVRRFLESGAAVYCEQGIRSMYFSDFPAVRQTDDYSWATNRCAEFGIDTHLDGISGPAFDGLAEEIDSVSAQLREAAFSLIDSGSGVYGERYARALGDVASAFLTSHEDVGTGRHFRSFALSRRAATDPGKLYELQRYYKRAFLPQPLEREWLRRHDRELELLTHARNERIADYVVAHNQDATAVHVIVGAAHQPGVTYYLERHRDGRRRLEDFEFDG